MPGTVLGPKGSAVNDTNLVPDLMELTERRERQPTTEFLIPDRLISLQRKARTPGARDGGSSLGLGQGGLFLKLSST